MHKAKGAPTSVFPLRKCYTEQIPVFVRMHLRNHRHTTSEALYTQYQIFNVANAREWEFTAQTVWWCWAVVHLRGNIGPHITSSDRGERGFQNDDGVKNRYLKFWRRIMWARPSNNRCYGAMVQNSFQKSLILRSFSAMNSCSIARRSTWSINCLWMCKSILWFKFFCLSLFVK